MLAIVEQQQHPLVCKTGYQAGERIVDANCHTQHTRYRAQHQARVAERRQIDEPDAVFITGDHAFRDVEGDRGLANAAGPDDRHQALARNSRDQRRHRFLAADHPRCRERQIVHPRRRSCQGQRSSPWPIEAYWGDEIVAPSWNGDDVAMAVLAVAEGTAQSADLNLQIRFFHERSWPGSGDQLFLADHLAGMFDQSGQDVEGAAAEPHRLVALEQKPLRCNEAERAKRDRTCVHEVASPNAALFTRFYLTAARAKGPAAAQVELARAWSANREATHRC
jgi:hypothetical protein